MPDQPNITVVEALVVKPGDRLLLTVPADVPADALQNLMAGMQERYPDVEVTIIGNVGVSKIEGGKGVADAIREVVAHASIQYHDTPVGEMLADVADLIDPPAQEDPR